MLITERQKRFLKKRRKLIRVWPYLGTLLLLFIAVFIVWLLIRKPLLVNPFYVINGLGAGTIEQSTLLLMAGMLPIMFAACLLLLIAIVIFTFSAFSNEKKHIKVIDHLLEDRSEKDAQ